MIIKPKMLYRYLLCFCFTFVFSSTIGQVLRQDIFSLVKSVELDKCHYYYEADPNTDSLYYYSQSILKNPQLESDSISRALAFYFGAMADVQKDSSSFYNQLNEFRDLTKFQFPIQSKVYSDLAEAIFYRYQSRFQASIELNNKNLDLIEKLPIDSTRINQLSALIKSTLSSSYYNIGDYELALKSAMEAQAFASKAKDPLRLIRSYQNISAVYGDLSSSEKNLGSAEDRESYSVEAEKYLNLAYQKAKEENISRMLSISAYNLAVYNAIRGNNVSADTLLTTVINNTQKIKFTNLLFSAYLVKSDVQLELNRSDSSEYFALKAQDISKTTNNIYQKLKSGYTLSNIYHDRGKYEQARYYAENSLSKAKEIGNIKWQRMGFELLEIIEASSGNFKKAYKYAEKHQEIQDSLMSASSIARINELKEKYESDLKLLEIESLKNESELQQIKIEKKNRLIFGLLITGLLLGLLFYFFFRQRILKAELNEIDAKQKLLRSQLNPHFLFNVLNSIQQSIYLERDPEMIADLVAKFSRLTRRILQYTQEKFISLEEEILFLRDYMDLQQIRFDEPFHYSILLEEGMVAEEVLIPPMFTQAFVENSIEHGILHKREQGEITISFSRSDNSLKMVLLDNGVGREKAEFYKRNKKHRSLATKITLERLLVLEKKFRRKATLAIKDVTNRHDLVTGTRVTLHIPYFNE